MSGEIVFLLVLLAVTIALFVSDRFRLDGIAVAVILALMLSGILTPGEALAGFGDPVVVLIALLFVVGDVLFRTGVAFVAGNWLSNTAGGAEIRVVTLLMLVVAVIICMIHDLRRNPVFLNVACVLTFTGVWIEKGIGMIIPGYVPTPLGEVYEYLPNLTEVTIALGIWATGLLLYTIFVRITIPVLSGRLKVDREYVFDSGASTTVS